MQTGSTRRTTSAATCCATRKVASLSASSREKDARSKTGANVEAAKAVGKRVAERAVAKGVKEVQFDRGGYLFHGRIKALADAARESGLKF